MGYWDNQGAAPTKATWKNPQVVAENKRANGGWYYNPGSGYVERWWSGGAQPQQNSGGGGGSQPARSGGGFDDVLAEQKRQEQARIDKENAQKAEQEGLFTEYSNKRGSQEGLDKAFDRLSTEAGIADDSAKLDVFKRSTGELQAGLEDTDQAITERTQGQFVSEAQRARQVAMEKGTLYDKLARLARNYEPVLSAFKEKQTGVATKLQLLGQQQERELDPLKMRIGALSDRFAREMTGFTQDKQNTLNILMAKLQRDQQLADDEWKNAQELAKEERLWEQKKEELALNAKYDIEKKGAGGGGGGGGNPFLTPQGAATTGESAGSGSSSGRLPKLQSGAGYGTNLFSGLFGAQGSRPLFG